MIQPNDLQKGVVREYTHEYKGGASETVQMVIVPDTNHIWEQAKKHFDIDEKHTVYTYGKYLYNPNDLEIDEPLLAHESTHTLQQADIGVEKWWKMYFENAEFRVLMEVEAYAVQYVEYCRTNKDRNRQAKYLYTLASHLSGGQYGEGIITHSQAVQRIKEETQ